MEPFYFKSYDKLIGVACDEESLLQEMKCLSKFDSAAVYYHLVEGHISMWLEYIGRRDLADGLKYISDVQEAVSYLEKNLRKGSVMPRKRGRPKGSSKKKDMQEKKPD
ncbi:TVG0887956 [Thermoplasma volcanium GSS1]|uniref:TVG0887956 protein n=1 Tax=Thermoplasma volcanium (strain ATCC 51530 / DSM 4299 / JCM 9571 / NBRC 15438 / GSS1) TaxID=273116 RepID=Q97AE1_THEVO|nr:hypothetical protein [Thermoplasma volcanium]BAB60011.1 TVG0887956 [Thermoplasma volcanium GSS1]